MSFAKIKFICIASFLFFVIFSAAQYFDEAPIFSSRVDLGLIENDEIQEASGIAASRKNSNVLWTHNDSKNDSALYAFRNDGRHLGKYFLQNIVNRDWEDIAIGPGPDDSIDYIYIADIGDDDKKFDLKYIYRFPEPVVNENQQPEDFTIPNIDIIILTYPDENRDAETLMIDPISKDIYIISKKENNFRVYRSPYPQSISTIQSMELEGKFSLPPNNDGEPFIHLVAGDIAENGNEIILKTYWRIYYWKRSGNMTVMETLITPPVELPYNIEPQGESLCWDPEGNGYYTLSEENIDFNGTKLTFPAHLYYYSRVTTGIKDNSIKPTNCFLFQNYPNPFNPETTIKYSIPSNPDAESLNKVRLVIFDNLGREIAVIVDKEQNPGDYKVYFNASSTGLRMNSGVYYFRLTMNNFSETKKMLYIK